jgi:hypothetical protein
LYFAPSYKENPKKGVTMEKKIVVLSIILGLASIAAAQDNT